MQICTPQRLSDDRCRGDTEAVTTARNVTERRNTMPWFAPCPQDANRFHLIAPAGITNGRRIDLGSPRRAPGRKIAGVLPSVV